MEDTLTISGIEKIKHKIFESFDDNIGIFSGDLSNALFWFYLGKETKEEKYLDKGVAILDHHLDMLSKYRYGFKFGYGVPGVAWVLQFLVANDLIDDQGYFEQFDTLIEKSLKWNFEDDYYDLFVGYLGKGLYFVERYEYTKDKKIKKVLASIVDAIEASSKYIKDIDGRVWFDIYTSNYSEYRKGDPYFGMGLSHGIPSILYFLCICHSFGVKQKKTALLIQQSVNWIMLQEDNYSFPDVVYPDGDTTKKHTLAWGYGTLSVCVSLYAAAKVLEDESLLQKVKEIVTHNAEHYNIDNAKLNNYKHGNHDICVCFGTAGIAHLLIQFGKVFSTPSLIEIGNYWIQQTLNLIDVYPFDKSETTMEIGLLEGPAGVGVVLLDQTSNGQYKWNKIFLTDIERF